MLISNEKMVSLTYTLREDDKEGRVVETVDDANPLKFMFGAGQMLPHFEMNIDNLAEGADFEFGLLAEDAYGERREDMIVDLPRSVFEVDGKFDEEVCKVGNQVPMADAQGRRLLGIVTEISNGTVKMDFNHPMAGINIHFTGKVLNVREATEEEMNAQNGIDCGSCGSGNSCGGTC